MSGAAIPLQPLNVKDPRINVTEGRSYVVLRGGKEINPTSLTASTYSTSGVSWSVPPPSPDTITDRRILLKMPMQFDFTGSGTGNLLQLGVNDAPRAFPISMCIETMNIILNGVTFTCNLSDIFTALSRYGIGQESLSYDQSLTPSALDFYSDYGDWSALPPTGGSGRNPLQGLGEGSGLLVGRGGFPVTVVSNTNTTAQVRATFVEPLMFLAPLLFGDRQGPGLVGLNSMQIQIRFGDLRRMWSHTPNGGTAGSNTISSLAVSFLSAPSLLVNYITPQPVDPSLGGAMLPRAVYYPYYRFIPSVTNVGSIAAGVTTTVTSSSINFPCIPNCVWIYARRSNREITGSLAGLISSTDTFGLISRLNITYNNHPGIFGSCTSEQLYINSRQRGLQMSWPQASQETGYPVKLDFGLDIPLGVLEAPSLLSNSNFQFQATVTFTNISAAAVDYDLYIVQMVEGTTLLVDDRCVVNEGVLTKQDILSAQSIPTIDYYDIQKNNMYGGGMGGGWWESLKSFAGRVARGVERAVPVVQKAWSIAQPIISGLRGYGITGGGAGGPPSESKETKRSHTLMQRPTYPAASAPPPPVDERFSDDDEYEHSQPHGGGAAGGEFSDEDDDYDGPQMTGGSMSRGGTTISRSQLSQGR